MIALVARTLPGVRTIDDSYITYRYAINILNGYGFTYNPGEAVQGTTTPLYTLWMVFLGFIFGGAYANFPLLSLISNAIFDAFTCYLIIQIGRQLNAKIAGYATSAVWAVAPYSVTFAIGGLETSLYIFLCTLFIYAFITNHNKTLFITGALSLLTRPDAILLLAPVALHYFIKLVKKKERISLQNVLLALIPLLLWYGFAWITFGSPFPHSVQAKMVAYRLEPFSALIRLIQHYATPFLEHLTFSNYWIAAGIIIYPFIFWTGARKSVYTNINSISWFIYPWLYMLVFSIPNPLIFRWYLTPPLPPYIFGILYGFEIILEKLSSRFRIKSLQILLPFLLIVILPVASSLRGWQLKQDHGPNRPAPSMAWIKLEELYQNAAQLISPHILERQTIAAGDVGVIGYFSGAHILDTVGLNSEQALRYYPLDNKYYVINYAIAPDLIIDESPDWVIFLEVYGRNGLLMDERFFSSYNLFAKLDTDIYGSEGMLIFQKNSPR